MNLIGLRPNGIGAVCAYSSRSSSSTTLNFSLKSAMAVAGRYPTQLMQSSSAFFTFFKLKLPSLSESAMRLASATLIMGADDRFPLSIDYLSFQYLALLCPSGSSHQDDGCHEHDSFESSLYVSHFYRIHNCCFNQFHPGLFSILVFHTSPSGIGQRYIFSSNFLSWAILRV